MLKDEFTVSPLDEAMMMSTRDCLKAHRDVAVAKGCDFRFLGSAIGIIDALLGKPSPITRVEIIQENVGRLTVKRGEIELSFQDDGRTLKVFLKSRTPILDALPRPLATDGEA